MNNFMPPEYTKMLYSLHKALIEKQIKLIRLLEERLHDPTFNDVDALPNIIKAERELSKAQNEFFSFVEGLQAFIRL